MELRATAVGGPPQAVVVTPLSGSHTHIVSSFQSWLMHERQVVLLDLRHKTAPLPALPFPPIPFRGSIERYMSNLRSKQQPKNRLGIYFINIATEQPTLRQRKTLRKRAWA